MNVSWSPTSRYGEAFVFLAVLAFSRFQHAPSRAAAEPPGSTPFKTEFARNVTYLLAHGTNDRTVKSPQVPRFEQALRDAGIFVETFCGQGRSHGFPLGDEHFGETVNRIEGYLSAVWNPDRLPVSNNAVELSHGDLVLRIEAQGQTTASLVTKSGRETMIVEAPRDRPAPQQYVKVNGHVVKRFEIDCGSVVKPKPMETAHGRGKRIRFWGTAALPGGGRLKKTASVELYERYPNAVLFHTRYRNVGERPIHVDTLYEAVYRLAPDDLWAFHPRNWRAGEDFIFPVERGVQLEGDNVALHPRGDMLSIYGGGLPAVSFMSPKLTLTVGYVSPHVKMVRFPIRDDGSAIVVGIERDLGLGPEPTELAPGDELQSFPTFIALARGDFYDGIRVMSRLHQDIGLEFRDPPIADVQAPAWSNRGIGHRWDKEYILDQLPLLKRFGIKWIHMGDPWQDNLGDYGVSDKFSDPDDLRSFIRLLNTEGFHVTAFYSDLVVDPDAAAVREHPEYFIQQQDGSPLRARSFGGVNYFVLCPAYAPAREFVRSTAEKLAVYYGFDGVKNDGHTMPLPCFHPAHHHRYPEESVERYHLMQKTVYETFAQYKPDGFVVAFCFDGVVPYFYQHHYTTRPWPNADQKSEQQARWKQKLFKAVFGPQRLLLDDHSDAKYLSGQEGTWYLGPVSGLAMGSVLETVIGPSYDYQNHDYDRIFAAFHREQLPDGGKYLNLYHTVFDKPEGHVVEKDGTLYYGFFAPKFRGSLELRGLEDGAVYRVTDYLDGREFPAVTAKGSRSALDARFESYLLLRLRKAD
ncbi:MAG: alpha-amylase family protein [Planctomycetota bacterium]|jgi:alpha-galactosidase